MQFENRMAVLEQQFCPAQRFNTVSDVYNWNEGSCSPEVPIIKKSAHVKIRPAKQLGPLEN